MARLRVLVIDDEPSVLLTYTMILERNKFQAVGAATLAEARAALDKGSFDSIVCDLNVESDGAGLGFLDEARNKFPRATAILLTGYATDEQADEAERKGIALLLKPVAVPDLVRAIEGQGGQQRTA